MATLTIRNLPDAVRDRLRIRAAQNGRSMEAEARDVLVRGASADALPQPGFEEAAQVAQDYFRQFRTSASAVDELIAERRLEAWSETVKTLRSAGERQASSQKSGRRPK
jgi:plasmid stability protein